MDSIKVEQEMLVNATHQSVWDMVSDIDSVPKYWKGTTGIRNISRDRNTTRREIVLAFSNKKCMQEVTVHHKTHVSLGEAGCARHAF